MVRQKAALLKSEVWCKLVCITDWPAPRPLATSPHSPHCVTLTRPLKPYNLLQHKQLNMESAGRQPVAYDLRRATYNHSRNQGVISMQWEKQAAARSSQNRATKATACCATLPKPGSMPAGSSPVGPHAVLTVKDIQQRAAHTLRSLASAVRGRLQGGQRGSLRKCTCAIRQRWQKQTSCLAPFSGCKTQCTTL